MASERTIQACVTSAERDALQAEANRLGLSVSALVRQRAIPNNNLFSRLSETASRLESLPTFVAYLDAQISLLVARAAHSPWGWRAQGPIWAEVVQYEAFKANVPQIRAQLEKAICDLRARITNSQEANTV